MKTGKSLNIIGRNLQKPLEGSKMSDYIEILRRLADAASNGSTLKADDFKNVQIERSGTRIVLPDGMDYSIACEWLKRREEEEETVVAISEEIDAYPMDGALSLAKTLQRIYGWTNLAPTPGFFGKKNPPQMISVEIGPNQIEQVAWGRMVVPGIQGFIETSWGKKDGRPIFVLCGEVKRKHEKHLRNIAEAVKETVRNESIYRKKAIRISFRDEKGNVAAFAVNRCPKFIDTSKINEEELIFSEDVAQMVKTCIYNPIEHTEACRKFRIPLKRGIMLEGPYGTGKTLTASVVAKKCEENGWTFVYLDDVRDLDQGLDFAKLYSPAVLFAEDLDRAINQHRNSDTDRILNTLDGVNSKASEVIVILTSNEINQIHKAMIRPGRIDTVIPVRHPDINAIISLVRLYGRGLVQADDLQLESALCPLVGFNAAVVRETVERAKLASVEHCTDTLIITSQDLAVAAKSMIHHLNLLKESPEKKDEGRFVIIDASSNNNFATSRQLKAVAESLGCYESQHYDR